jgi:hypothetical protein
MQNSLNRFNRCIACNGTGLTTATKIFCGCKLGKDLERETFRRLREEQSKRDNLRLKMEAMGL